MATRPRPGQRYSKEERRRLLRVLASDDAPAVAVTYSSPRSKPAPTPRQAPAPNTSWLAEARREVYGEQAGAAPSKAPERKKPDLKRSHTWPAWPSKVRFYSDLGAAFLRQELASVGRVYALALALDDDGRGWIDEAWLRARLTYKYGRKPLFTWRRLRQILAEGEGICWHRGDDGRLWLMGAHRVAVAMGVDKLRQAPVYLRVRRLRDGMQSARAEFYAAWHAGRRGADTGEQSPLTRATIEELTGVKESSQRNYEELAGIDTKLNILIEGEHSKELERETHWQHPGVFRYVDWAGKMGPKAKPYVARMGPNTYDASLQRAARGRLRKVNRRIDLVKQGARGNGSDVYRMYHPTAAAAQYWQKRDSERDHYYRQGGGWDRAPEQPARLQPVALWQAWAV